MNATPDIYKNPMGLSKGMEWALVITLFLTFGFVMFDRFALTNMSTFVMADLNIDLAQLGLISTSFAVAWAICGYFGGMFADMSKSKKKFILILTFLFSILSLSSGFAGGFVALAVIRFLMGVVEGPVLPLVQTFLVHESTPARRGFNQGLVQVSAVGLISSFLGPIICAALASTIGWRGAFYVTIIPGLIICVMIIFLIKEPIIQGTNVVEDTLTKNEADGNTDQVKEEVREKASVKEAVMIFKQRNVILSCIGAVFILYCYLNVLTFAQSFLVNDRGFDAGSAGLALSFLGIGAVFWGAVLPRISDIIGRRYALTIGCILTLCAPLGMIYCDSYIGLLVLCFIGWACGAVSGMFQSTVPSESVDRRYSTTAIGLVQAIGELLGGGLGATLCGIICNTYGTSVGFITCAISILIVIPLALAAKETAPAVVAKKAAKAGN